MTIDFFGLFFLGLGPGLAFFIVVLARKSFLVLLSLFSAFLWLVVLLATSAVFRGFVPLRPEQGPYAGMLIASVAIEEMVRCGAYWIHSTSLRTLESMARSSGHRFSVLDKLYMALAWGYGHAASHAVFFFLSFLPLTVDEGTYYNDTCPQMSIFLVGALYSLSFGVILTCLMVISFDGFLERNIMHIVAAPLVHLGASCLTLINYKNDGCIVSMPILLALGLLLVLYTIFLSWKKVVR